jgi:acyl-CoA synthetase (AMP-forming)/AMP-acid ligase II
VTPREIEVALEELKGVQAAYVVAVPHPDRGENVAAAIVANRGVELSPEALSASLKDVLSAYKIPRHYFFLESDALPFTDSGKIQKNRLSEMLAARLSESGEA